MIFQSFLRLCAIEPRLSVRVTSDALFFCPNSEKHLQADLKSAVRCPDIMRENFQKRLVVDPFPVRISERQKIFLQGGLENGLSQSEQVRGLFLTDAKAGVKSVSFPK